MGPMHSLDVRGMFIVFEGMDRSGKTTQLDMLYTKLLDSGCSVVKTKFPDEEYDSGRRCRLYINQKVESTVADAHELFAENRRDAQSKLSGWLAAGRTVLCDRYAYSGVAYSTAKGMAFEVAKDADRGLIEPDLVLVLLADAAVLAKRSGFGSDVHDDVQLQNRVCQVFRELAEAERKLHLLDAAADKDMLHRMIYSRVTEARQAFDCASRVGSLWPKIPAVKRESHSTINEAVPK